VNVRFFGDDFFFFFFRSTSLKDSTLSIKHSEKGVKEGTLFFAFPRLGFCL
jgi:hypothetical protein